MASVMCQGPKQAKVTTPRLFLGALTPPTWSCQPGLKVCCYGPPLFFYTGQAAWHPRVPQA